MGRRDHPRSRGVYMPEIGCRLTAEGSSPLARGLPAQKFWASCLYRIIPARAGFTPRASRRRWLTRDHPRSRGVYPRLTVAVSARWGSSPLARGLRLHGDPEQGPLRIIPARAGFTTRTSRRRRTWTDHPRSRGVYLILPGLNMGVVGSSPLARGLRLTHDMRERAPRIIPARAGFTTAANPPVSPRTDHPRSRGVYILQFSALDFRGGSSPLARGLRAPARLVTGGGRIIPARAGFT